MVRLDETDANRPRVPGIIVRIFCVEAPPTFEVLAGGERWVVTNKDVGPVK
jgi:hypothetical protein